MWGREMSQSKNVLISSLFTAGSQPTLSEELSIQLKLLKVALRTKSQAFQIK